MVSLLSRADLTSTEMLLLEGLDTDGPVDVASPGGTLGGIRAQVLFQILAGMGDMATSITRRLDLRNAVITDRLDLSEMTIAVPMTFTSCTFEAGIELDRASTRSIVFEECTLEKGLTAEGTRVSGRFCLTGGKFTNPEGIALNMYQARITGGLFAGEGFEARGEVRLVGVSIDGRVALTGGKFTNPDGYALYMDQARITGGLFAGEGFEARGEVRLLGASIDGQVALTGGKFKNPNGTALSMNGAKITGKLTIPVIDDGEHLSFRDASVNVLAFTSLRDAPAAYVDGLAFSRVDPGPEEDTGTVDGWIDWLGRDPSGFRPGPYTTLANTFAAAGHDGEARQVLIAGEDARYRRAPWRSRVWGWLKRWTVRYGYRPELALLWLVAWLILGSLLLWWPRLGWWVQFTAPSFMPGQERVAAENVTSTWLYLFDQLIPLIDLPQNLGVATANQALTWGVIGYVMLGWALGIAAIAGVAKTLTRE